VLASGKLKTTNSLPVGAGGNLSLEITGLSGVQASAPTREQIVTDGTILAQGFQGGGTLTLEALAFQIGGLDDPTARPSYATYFDPTAWGDRGFGSFVLSAFYDAVVPDGATVTLRHVNRVVSDPSILSALSGSNLAAYTSLAVLAEDLRSATNLTVAAGLQHGLTNAYLESVNYTGSADYGSAAETTGLALDAAVIGANAVIMGDPKAKIAISTKGGILAVYGEIIAPGGSIALTAGGYTNVSTVASDLYLAPTSRLDVSGTTVLSSTVAPVMTADGLVTPRIGTVLDGGSVTLSGDIVVASGAVIDVAGAAATLDVLNTSSSRLSGGASYSAQAEWSNGGSVTFNGSLAFDGTLIGNGGSTQAAGATLILGADDGGSIILVQNAIAAGLNLVDGVGSYRSDVMEPFPPSDTASPLARFATCAASPSTSLCLVTNASRNSVSAPDARLW